ncbi:transposase (fragment) [Candidatus Methanoperedens nitroreducens]|uniref:Transposase n=1 Tax=Candidatus Methanoperedens nitratireducens TaxID=1392998 RepID=A0A284VQ49_9EURY
MVSAVANSPKSISIHAESTNELKTLRIGPWIKDRILLIDLGFYKHQLFARIKENGCYFVSRLKGNADPLIVDVHNTCRGNSIDVKGKYISEILPKLKRQVLDVEVEVSFKRRKYNGKERLDTEQFRLVAVFNEDEEKYHVYLTNISKDVLEAEDVAKLYGARWDIETVMNVYSSQALDPHVNRYRFRDDWWA